MTPQEIKERIYLIIAEELREELGKDIGPITEKTDLSKWLKCGSPIHILILNRIGTAIKNSKFIADVVNISKVEELLKTVLKSYNEKDAWH